METTNIGTFKTRLVGTVTSLTVSPLKSGKSMTVIRIESPAYGEKVQPFEVKAFKPVEITVGDSIEITAYVNGSFGRSDAMKDRVFTDLTLAEYSIKGSATTTAEKRDDKPVAQTDEPLPF